MPFRRILLAALLTLLAAPAARAQTAAVHGHALAADGAPVPLSVIRLVPDGAGRGRVTLTDARGAFRFDTVAAGAYLLQMDRIGYTATPSARFAVADGETSEQTLRATLRPVLLEAVSNGPPACYTRDRLHEAPAVEALWREALKGVEQRRAFAQQYAYLYNMRTNGVAHLRLVRDRRIRGDSTVLAHPDTFRARAARSASTGQRRSSLLIQVPSDLALVRDDFLADHCLEANPQHDSTGAWTLRFRAVRAPRDTLTLAGALRLDDRTFAVRRVEFRYMEGRREWATGTLDYGDVATTFGRMRLPARAAVHADPSGAMGMVLTGVDATVEFHRYRDFRRVGGN